ncbi:hypothetical protein [Thioclava sp.]|uniref:hypothetical protein n=1 Tax=Thioclava sp. TaxID=1933450 RepID=UPI0032421626
MIRALFIRFTKPRRDLIAERDALMHEARKLRWQHKSTKDVQAKLEAVTNECLRRGC